MKLLAFGTEPVGVVAIGANASGIVAIGQLATGVVAVGQLARGGVVIGQLGVGLVCAGQLGLGVIWSAGMLGVGGTSGPGFIAGLFGRLYLLRLFGRQEGPALPWRELGRRRVAVAAVLLVALAALWWLAAGQWLVDALTRTGGISSTRRRHSRACPCVEVHRGRTTISTRRLNRRPAGLSDPSGRRSSVSGWVLPRPTAVTSVAFSAWLVR